VIDVIAATAAHRSCWIVRMSAIIPAPADGSNPAIARTIGCCCWSSL